jgi:hypothetical protein
MLNTYIKNRGHSETLFHNNNKNKFNEIDWEADYDGKTANISVTSDIKGRKRHYDIKLDNDDLANILNVSSVQTPIHKRLEQDFNEPVFRNDPLVYQIELPNVKTPYMTPATNYINKLDAPSIDELLESDTPDSYLSSPLPNEELIIPLALDKKTSDKYTFTPKRRHKKIRTHNTYKVYKKRKSSSLKSKSKTKTLRKKTTRSYSVF